MPVLDNNGEVELLFYSLRDVTKRKHAEIQLNETETRYRLVFENSVDGILITHPDGPILAANPAACKMLGRTEEEICRIGRNGIMDTTDIRLHAALEERARTGKFVGELTLIKKDGTSFNCELSSSIIKRKNGEFGVVIIRDISERKKIEQEMSRLDRLNLVGQMAAGISHEIRNPMTTVRGFLQIIQSKLGSKEFDDYFNLMISELDRANSIITEFLNVAKNRTTELKNHNLNSIINTIKPLIIADAMNTDIRLNFELDDIPNLQLNEKEIRQLILNLVRNGLEAMNPGKILTIKTQNIHNEVIMSVKDQGIGIDQSIIDKVGTPFFTTKRDGTGLGLATCFSIAERHNAAIDIETGSDGTTFNVKFRFNIH